MEVASGPLNLICVRTFLRNNPAGLGQDHLTECGTTMPEAEYVAVTRSQLSGLELEPGPEMQSVVEYWLVQSYIWLQMMALPEERL